MPCGPSTDQGRVAGARWATPARVTLLQAWWRWPQFDSWASREGGAAARGDLVVVSDVRHSRCLWAARAAFPFAVRGDGGGPCDPVRLRPSTAQRAAWPGPWPP